MVRHFGTKEPHWVLQEAHSDTVAELSALTTKLKNEFVDTMTWRRVALARKGLVSVERKFNEVLEALTDAVFYLDKALNTSVNW